MHSKVLEGIVHQELGHFRCISLPPYSGNKANAEVDVPVLYIRSGDRRGADDLWATFFVGSLDDHVEEGFICNLLYFGGETVVSGYDRVGDESVLDEWVVEEC